MNEHREPPDTPPAAGAPGPHWQGDGALRPAPPAPPASAADESLAVSAASPPLAPAVLRRLVLATVRRRAAAWLVDAFIKFLFVEVVLTLGGVGAAADPFAPSLLVAGQLLSRGYDWIFMARGWTPGTRLLGMRIVRAEDGGEPGPARALVRVGGAMLSELAFGLGFAWALRDRYRQTWQDKLARTFVVMAPPEDRR